jgi:hypothetical protein
MLFSIEFKDLVFPNEIIQSEKTAAVKNVTKIH